MNGVMCLQLPKLCSFLLAFNGPFKSIKFNLFASDFPLLFFKLCIFIHFIFSLKAKNSNKNYFSLE